MSSSTPRAQGDDSPGAEAARERRLGRTSRRRVRRRVTLILMWIAVRTVPAVYLAYMRLVWATSNVRDLGLLALKDIARKHDGAVGLLWHEEVFTVAYGYYWLGFRPHTLASLGDAGEVITRLLNRCGFVVFRGGSTTARSRRREGIIRELVEHMETHREVIYGLTVDGAKGPPYVMKSGSIVVARECGKPIVLSRTWYKRCVRLPTWDRMAIPLPFNRIRYWMRGPYFVPEDASTPEGLERFRHFLDGELMDLAAQSYREMGQTLPPALVEARRRHAAAAAETAA